jgi:protein phosphatase
MIYYAKTHKGNVRKLNEDAVYIPEDGIGFFAILADGMGGHNAGDVASSLVVNTVSAFLNDIEPAAINEESVRDALCHANTLIWNESCANSNRNGMGSTATVAVFVDSCVYIGQVGDSRAYLYRDGAISQITKDHSYVQLLIDRGFISKEDATRHPQKNIITRAVGTECDVEVDTFIVELKGKDVILLCSDGLNNTVPDDEIAKLLSGDLTLAAERLIQAALDNGGTDNISVIIAVLDGGAQ